MSKQPHDLWDYTCHILLANNKVMEVEGSMHGTSDDVSAKLEAHAEREGGVVNRLYMKSRGKDSAPSKPRVRTLDATPETQTRQTLALPAPTSKVPKQLLKVTPYDYPQPKTFVRTNGDDDDAKNST